MQKNFEGKLVGADRAKDLAVLKVHCPSFTPPPQKKINLQYCVNQPLFVCLVLGKPKYHIVSAVMMTDYLIL